MKMKSMMLGVALAAGLLMGACSSTSGQKTEASAGMVSKCDKCTADHMCPDCQAKADAAKAKAAPGMVGSGKASCCSAGGTCTDKSQADAPKN